MTAHRIRPAEATRTNEQKPTPSHIRIDRPAAIAQIRRNSELRDRIAAALVNSGYAALSRIGCEVENNRVILRGSVASYHLKQLAQEHALRVDGIGRLENRLEVRGRGPR
jgi:osmotically-inducible protein OsmY